MEQSIETIAYLKRIDGKLDYLKQTLQNMPSTQSHKYELLDNSFLSMFPMKNLDSLQDFDNRLKIDEHFKANVVKL